MGLLAHVGTEAWFCKPIGQTMHMDQLKTGKESQGPQLLPHEVKSISMDRPKVQLLINEPSVTNNS